MTVKRTKFPGGSPLKINTSDLATRLGFAATLGKSFGGQRDLYAAMGYPLNITFEAYLGRFLRQDICSRVVSASPDATWRGVPKVVDNSRGPDADQTEFEKAWEKLVEAKHVYHYLNRVDVLSGIGRYGVLLLGTNAAQQDMSKPLDRASELLYMKPLYEAHASVHKWVTDERDERYGKPESYNLTVAMQEGQSRTIVTHWTRVIHVAEGLLEDDVYGRPRLEPVFNRMEDIARLSGGSAEMFWKGAFPGLAFTAQEGATFTDDDLTAMEDEIQDYFNGLARYLRMQGVNVNELSPQVASPEMHFELQLQLVAGTSGIPKRILLGSEQGELASSQDENNWLARVDERRKDQGGPMILRPFIDRLVDIGILPEPKDGYTIEWPDIDTLSEKEQADVNKTKAETIKAYCTAPGADMLIPPVRFLEDFMGYDPETAKEMADKMADLIEEEEAMQAELESQLQAEADNQNNEPLPGEDEA